MDKVIEILNELLNIPDRSADGEYYKPHTDDEIKKASQAIDALYQGDEEGLLSDEQIQDAIESHPKLFLQDFHFQRLMLAARQVRDAQHALDKRREQERKKGFPKIVCLCGSTRFVEYYNHWRKEFTLQGYIVLGIELVVPQTHQQDPQHNDYATKKILDELHMRKIDLADEVFVLNVEGYIGESTRNEINYAKSISKPVNFLEQEGL